MAHPQRVPDWQLPPGVDRGLWDYFASAEMVSGYDAQMSASALAAQDIQFCERHFKPGSLLDLGCGTGRLGRHFASHGFDCTGVDLSDEMLAAARAHSPQLQWLKSNIVELREWADHSFDNIACLFSTFGMVRGDANREAVLRNVRRLLKPRGVFVLHAHNRRFRRLGLRRHWTREFTMPQAYGGAPLTIRHFDRDELEAMLMQAGFQIGEVLPFGEESTPPKSRGATYGYLFAVS